MLKQVKKDTRFKPGQSGNKNGRPLGSRSKAVVLAEQLARGQLNGIVKATLEAAKDGDTSAQRLLLERLWPVPKGTPRKIDGVPPVKTLSDVQTAVTAIIAKMTSGEISPEEALSVSAVVETQRRAIETIDLEKRIAAIEAREAE